MPHTQGRYASNMSVTVVSNMSLAVVSNMSVTVVSCRPRKETKIF
jgi:hypothetical protein